MPNKPMVPTATNRFNDDSRDPMRRHIGQSLDSQAGDGRRPTKEQVVGRGQRTPSGEQRPTKEQVTGHAQRTSGDGPKVARGEFGQRTTDNEGSGVTTDQVTLPSALRAVDPKHVGAHFDRARG